MTTYTISANSKLEPVEALTRAYFIGRDGTLCISGGMSGEAQSIAYLPVGGAWRAQDFRLRQGNGRRFGASVSYDRVVVEAREASEIVGVDVPLGSFVVTDEGSGIVTRFDGSDTFVVFHVETGVISHFADNKRYLTVTSGTVRGYLGDDVAFQYELGDAFGG